MENFLEKLLCFVLLCTVSLVCLAGRLVEVITGADRE